MILGEIGKGFGAGMTGGIAYVLDLDPLKVNLQMVDLELVCSGNDATDATVEDGAPLRKGAETLQNLLNEHCQRTHSMFAQTILSNFNDYLPR